MSSDPSEYEKLRESIENNDWIDKFREVRKDVRLRKYPLLKNSISQAIGRHQLLTDKEINNTLALQEFEQSVARTHQSLLKIVDKLENQKVLHHHFEKQQPVNGENPEGKSNGNQFEVPKKKIWKDVMIVVLFLGLVGTLIWGSENKGPEIELIADPQQKIKVDSLGDALAEEMKMSDLLRDTLYKLRNTQNPTTQSPTTEGGVNAVERVVVEVLPQWAKKKIDSLELALDRMKRNAPSIISFNRVMILECDQLRDLIVINGNEEIQVKIEGIIAKFFLPKKVEGKRITYKIILDNGKETSFSLPLSSDKSVNIPDVARNWLENNCK